MKKRIASIILTCCMVLSLLPTVAFAGNVLEDKSGYCGAVGDGTNLSWSYDSSWENLRLTISGTGAMKDYASPYSSDDIAPWYNNETNNVVVVNITINEDVTSIGAWAFVAMDFTKEYGWEGNISLPSTLTSIGENAFLDCMGLDEIRFAGTVEQWGDIDIDATGNLSLLAATIHCTDGDIEGHPTSGTCGDNLTWEIINGYSDYDNTLYISGTGAMYDFDDDAPPWLALSDRFNAIDIESGVTSIGNYAFIDCRNVTYVSIPDSITSIGESAFNHCEGLEYIEIPNGVTEIGDSAFRGCFGLPAVTIPASVTYIGEYAFGRCTSLTSITVSENNTAYCDVDGVLFNKDKTILHTFPQGMGAATFIVPEGVKEIATGAFYEYSGVDNIVFPASLEIIKDDACRHGFSSVTFVGTEEQWNEVTVEEYNTLPEIQFKPNYSGGGLVDDGSNPPTAPATAPVVTAKTTTTISISWDAGDDDVGIYGYDVYLNGQRIAELDGADVRAYQFTDLEQGQEYEIKVKTVDTGGHESEDFSPVLRTSTAALILSAPALSSAYIVDECVDDYGNLSKQIQVDTTVTTDVTGLEIELASAEVQYRATGENDWITQEYGMKVDADNSCNASGWFYISGNGEDGYLPMGQYDVRFSVVDSEGATAVSEAKTITLKLDDIPPTAPGTATLDSRNTVTLNFHWDASTDNVGVDHYVIYRDGVEVGTSTTTSYSDTGLTMATSYEYTIKAVDGRDNVSDASESATLKTATLSFSSYTDFDDTYMMEEQSQYKIPLAAEASSDGTLSAVTVRMEYKGSEDTDWESVSMTKTASTANTYSGNWPVKMNGEYLSPDAYNVRFVITDGYSSVTSDAQTVNLIRDNIDPVVQSISKPVANETYGGKDFSIEYRATDNIGVTQADIEYSVDGTTFTAITSKIYNELKDATDQFTWDATALASGTYQLRVSVRDAMNNVGTMIRQFNLDNTPPVPVFDLTAMGNTRYVTLSWTHSDPEEGMTYKVYRAVSADGDYTEIKEQTAQSFNEGQDVITPDITYYYKVTALDRYGNESESPAAASTKIVLDAEGPSITEMTPADSAELCKTATIRVAATDNYMLDHAVLEYRTSGGSSWTAIDTQQAAANTSSATFSKTWDIANLATGDYELRVSVYDSTVNDTLGGKFTANAPGTMTKTVHITKYTPPVAPVVSAETGYKSVSLSWTYSGNADLLNSFSIYKANAESGPFTLVKTVTPTTHAYSGAIPVDQTIYFKVVANDKYEASAESSLVSATSIPEDTEAPVAVILPEKLLTASNLPFQFSGVNSTDNNEIVSYAWDFGDGTTSTEITPEHTYTTAGNYPVKLTVTDAFGNSNTAAATIQVINTTTENSDYVLVTVKTVDASTAALTPISGATIQVFYEDGETTTAISNENGAETLLMPIGKHVVGVSAGGYMPVTKELRVYHTESGTMEAVIGLSVTPLVDGKLTATEMTLDEIQEAGIDVNDPANQHVWKYSVTFEFVVDGQVVKKPVTVGYKVTSDNGGGGSGRYIPRSTGWFTTGGGGSSGGGASSGRYRAQVVPTTVEGFYLIIYGETHWLKEMYNVELLVTNESYLDTIEDCIAELELPDGLSLTTMLGEQQNAQINLGTIDPNNQSVVRWYVRGDKEGEYNLSANLTGDLVSGNISEPFSYNFRTTEPVKVYAGSALKMTVVADDLAINGEDYHVTFRLENVSDKSLYNLSLSITGIEEGQFIKKTTGNNQTTETRTETYNEDFEGSLTQSVTELKAGDYIECEVNIASWFETEETLQAKSKALFRTAAYRAAYIDLSSGIGGINVATLEGSTTTVPTEIIVHTTEKAEKEQQIFDRLVKRVTYDPENPDVVILLIYDPAEETDPQESMSGIIQEGDGWAMRWKVTYYVDKNGQKYDPMLEIYMDGVDEGGGAKFSVSLTNEDQSPWLTATGFDKTDFVKISVSGTSTNPIHIIHHLFAGYTNVEKVSLAHIRCIDTSAFEGCTALTGVTRLDSDLQAISGSAFKNCTNLQGIYGEPDNLTSIGADAFQNTKITAFDLGDKMTDLNAKAFEGCGSLNSISIPATLNTVGESAFAGCSNLSDVYYSGNITQWNEIVISSNNEPLLSAKIHYGNNGTPHIVYSEVDNEDGRSFEFNRNEEIEDLIFSQPSTAYNPRLSHFLSVMARSAYTKELVTENYKNLGFPITEDSFKHYNDDKYAGYCISKQKLSDGSSLVLITIRGSTGDILTGAEWQETDFNNLLNSNSENFLNWSSLTNDRGWHPGISDCADNVFNDLKSFLGGSIDTSNTTYVITGHSLAAGVGNLLSIKLDEAGVPNGHVYDYNFACPNVGLGKADASVWNNNGKHNNIINVSHYYDLVTSVPTNDIGNTTDQRWKKYGQTFTFANGFYTFWDAHPCEAYIDYLAKEYDVTRFTSSEFACYAVYVQCPVDVTVYDSNGSPVAGVDNNVANYYDKDVGEVALIFTSDDEKLFYLFGDEQYSVQFNGTDEGEMTCTFADLNLAGNEIKSAKQFTSVSLSDGKEFYSEICGDIETPDVKLYVVSNNDENTPLADVQEDGTEVPIQYTLTFNANGHGTAPEAQVINTGAKAAEPASPTASGYTFGGWFKESACTNPWIFDTDTVTADITLYAKWTANGSGGGGGAGGGAATSDSENPVTLPTATDNDNATVKSDADNAKTGDTVTVTVTPDEGYKVDGVKVTDKDGNPVEVTDNGDGTYSFKMPAGGVKVEPVVIEDEDAPTSGGKFVDVPKDAYYADAVDWAVKNDITTGTSETTFSPNEGCTRAQVVTFLWRAAGEPEATTTRTFSDVSADQYYATAVAWAVENDITQGIGDSKFGPDQTCTRGQIVTFLWRYQHTPVPTTNASFSDVADTAYYAQPVAWAAENKITNGVGDNKFAPNDTCTRAQVVTFLYRCVSG